MKFKTSSGIKSIVGRDLITDPYVAILELVKNSYDANAKQVIVSFNTNQYSNQNMDIINQSGKIYIVDNGHGMSKEDLENKWLYLAYSDKKEGTNEKKMGTSSNNKRNYVGSKGIGRFSSDRLGALLKIKTKVAHEDIEHQLTVNWDNFDGNLERLFEDIEVEYQENHQLSILDSVSYTIIEISHLRDTWQQSDLEHVAEKLERLKNPFSQDDDLEIYFGTNIFDGAKLMATKKHTIKNNIMDAIKEKNIYITGKIIGNHVDITLIDRGKIVYQLSKIDTHSLLSNVDRIDFSIHYLTTSGKSYFTKKMGIEPVNYGNIFIYRNGFHVNPYGNKDYDLFNLNSRKTQGHSRYLATRELAGFINIKDSQNHFKETSSRNHGFIENGYFKELEHFYMNNIHRPLEAFIRLVKFGEITIDETTKERKEVTFYNMDLSLSEKEKFKKYITRNGFNIVHFDEKIDFDENKPEKIIERFLEIAKQSTDSDNKIVKDIKKLDKQVQSLKKENDDNNKIIQKIEKKASLLEKQNINLTNKRSEQSYNEQITHHFKKLSSRLQDAVNELNKFKTHLSASDSHSFNTSLRKIIRTRKELDALQDVLTKTTLETRKGTNTNWIELAKWYLSDKKNSSPVVSIAYSDDGVLSSWNIPNTVVVEVIMMLGNLYENAKEHHAHILDFMFYETYFTVSSDSTLIPDEFLTKVFELGFTTKPNGTGIGLSQIQTFLKKYSMSIHVNNENNMVVFTVTKA